MRVENTTKGPLGLPGGILVPAKGAIDAPEAKWAAAMRHNGVKRLVAAGCLVVDGPIDLPPLPVRASRAEGGIAEPIDPFADLRNQAIAMGLHVDGRWGKERLAAEIEKAKANADQEHDEG